MKSDLLANLMHVLSEQGVGWQMQANCKDTDPDIFYPEGAAGRRQKGAEGPHTREQLEDYAAERFCRDGRCPVQDECLEYAVSHGIQDGTWGGMTSEARRELTKRRGTVLYASNPNRQY